MKFAILSALLCCNVLPAATITVTTLADAGAGSLREAIAHANTDAGADDIVFAGTINLPGTIRLQTALPDITDDLTIIGPATNDLHIERDTTQPTFRLFTITAGTVTLSRLWIGNGSVVGAAGVDAEGGGIHNAGTLTVADCILHDCTARGGNAVSGDGGAARGGGIFSTGSLTLNGVLVTGCAATGGDTDDLAAFGGAAQGGGIFVTGADLTLLTSGITECGIAAGANSATPANAGAANGAGMFAASALLRDSGVSDCTAATDSGAAAVEFSAASTLRRSSITGNSCTGLIVTGSTTLENSTISGNTGTDVGGIMVDTAGTVLLRYCTVVENTGAAAGGIRVVSGTLEVEGSIVAENTGPSPDVDGSVTDLANNLVGDDTGSTGFTVSALVGSQFNTIPALLEPLRESGMSRYHVPQWGSFAIDRGAAAAPFDDQRRANRSFGGTPDIGAVEFIVNQRPSFTSGGVVRVKADGGNHVVTGWATNISPGVAWESGQSLSFVVVGSRFAFESGPSIDPETGDLRFRPRDGEDGTYVFEVMLVDDGGTANSGQDTSAPRQLVIVLERDPDEDDDNECAASPRGGLPVALACVLATIACLRHRKRTLQPRREC